MDLNWPTAALILALVCVLAFRHQLARLIDRIEGIKGWLSAPKQPTKVAAPAEHPPDANKQLEELTAGFQNQLVVQQEARIIADLDKHGLKVSSPAEKVLLKHLAGTQLVLYFERVHAEIYGSQVRFLRWLSGQTKDVALDALKPFYDQGAAAAPGHYKNVSLPDWGGFLFYRGLIDESPASAAAGPKADPFGLHITTMGREYLKYLVDAHKADPWFG